MGALFSLVTISFGVLSDSADWFGSPKVKGISPYLLQLSSSTQAQHAGTYVYCTFPAFIFLSAQYVPGVLVSSCEIAFEPMVFDGIFYKFMSVSLQVFVMLKCSHSALCLLFLSGGSSRHIIYTGIWFSPILSDTPLPCLIMAGVCMEGESPCSSSWFMYVLLFWNGFHIQFLFCSMSYEVGTNQMGK